MFAWIHPRYRLWIILLAILLVAGLVFLLHNPHQPLRAHKVEHISIWHEQGGYAFRILDEHETNTLLAYFNSTVLIEPDFSRAAAVPRYGAVIHMKNGSEIILNESHTKLDEVLVVRHALFVKRSYFIQDRPLTDFLRQLTERI